MVSVVNLRHFVSLREPCSIMWPQDWMCDCNNASVSVELVTPRKVGTCRFIFQTAWSAHCLIDCITHGSQTIEKAFSKMLDSCDVKVKSFFSGRGVVVRTLMWMGVLVTCSTILMNDSTKLAIERDFCMRLCWCCATVYNGKTLYQLEQWLFAISSAMAFFPPIRVRFWMTWKVVILQMRGFCPTAWVWGL